MLARQAIRQYAAGQSIAVEVADQEIVLHYALAFLNESGLIGYRPGDDVPGPLLFKGGTALRKCVFGSTGRFSQDIDLDATHPNGFEAEIERAIGNLSPYFGIEFNIAGFRYSAEGNFSGTVSYEHDAGNGMFELQISYRLDPILDPLELRLRSQPYFGRVECGVPRLYGLDPYEMIGEKIVACNRRVGGSGKDAYDLFLWADRPFDAALVRRIAVLKAWTDQRRSPRFEPDRFLALIEPRNFRLTDLNGLVPRGVQDDPEVICRRVKERLGFLTATTDDEARVLVDQTSHREHARFEALKAEARLMASSVPR